MRKFKTLDLFAGIGGFSLGLERAGGFETVAFCEIEKSPRRVLKKHWPEVPCYHDVKELTKDILDRDGIGPIDVITGGFPCQDISTAGKQAGLGPGTRSGLFSEIVRLIGELQPRYVILENVANLLSGPSEQRGGWFGAVLGALAECGYDAEWENIPAATVGASHRRERVWIVAYPNEVGRERCAEKPVFGQSGIARQLVRGGEDAPRGWPTDAGLDRVAYGFPGRVDRIGALGNAVVPQIPELIGRAIMEAENAQGR